LKNELFSPLYRLLALARRIVKGAAADEGDAHRSQRPCGILQSDGV